jgi:hypothetical protein
VRVTDAVTDGRTFAADITTLSHADPLPIRWKREWVCPMRSPFIA